MHCLGLQSSGTLDTICPDGSDKFKNIDSKILLKKTIGLLKNKGFVIVNIDSTICIQKPKLSPYIPEIEKVLAETMEIEIDQVSVKATTTEKMGFEGMEEGISVHAVALIEKI